ncbi:DUF4270 family protein [Tenacibaculum jejuense]|uniref:Lipoprotein n=1 Tax=Tenacibaculum jejuense TaxID=584609 RepID=A0A238U4A1_9FLAO|nr:DUF4270 family protein [Tenacibaculum jejuense]SNR14039.1 conserved protein of unknown function [Tenacibaculum jejuense]
MKKIFYASLTFISFILMMSCEKDFREIGGNVISNNEFSTDKITLEVEITPMDISSVRADNITIGALGEYWFGVYNNSDYKSINASFVSQLSVATPNPQTVDRKSAVDEETQARKIDSFFQLDRVILKLPYTATNIRTTADNIPRFRLDSILGDATVKMPLSVVVNETFLNTLDPNNPTETNSFQSDANYAGTEVLNEDLGFEFSPSPNDTMYVITRSVSDVMGNVNGTYRDTIRLNNGNTNSAPNPFLAVPLDTDKMRAMFWDKFSGPEFENSVTFNNFFKGIKVETNATAGSLIPFQLSGNTSSAAVEFYYTITRYEIKEGETALSLKDTLARAYTFPLDRVRNSKYSMSPIQNTPPSNSFNIQGTAGSMARINILNGSELQNLRNRNILINDATLTFNIDASRDTTSVPLQMLLFRQTSEGDQQILDAITEGPDLFGGRLQLEDSKPSSYSFGITDYISDLISGEITENSPLGLRVFNTPTDLAIDPNTGTIRNLNIETYNWNPRGVTILNNSATNGEKRAKLTISFTEEKDNN